MNRKIFFDHIRKSVFGGRLTAEQVDGITRILNYRRENYPNMPAAELAYVLAAVRWETAGTMQPIMEYGGTAYFMRKYDITGSRPDKARELGNVKKGDGARYAGRGYVQITGRANYRKYGIEGNPDKALEPDTAARILFDGMIKGEFTGKKLADYINAGGADYVGARRIVNGADKAATFAKTAGHFRAALDEAAKAMPVTQDETLTQIEPDPPQLPKPAVQSTTIWAQVLQWLAAGGAATLTALGAIPWQTAAVLGGIAMAGAGLWIIRERLNKRKDHAV